MALANRKTRTQTEAAPAFEDDDVAAQETTTVVADEVVDQNVPINDKPVAVAQPRSVAPAPKRNKPVPAFSEYENVFDLSDAESTAGAVPKIIADLGGLDFGDKKDPCKTVKVELISFNRRYIVTTGVQGEDAKQFLRTSYDGVNISNFHMNVEEYVEHLKEVEGYEKTSVKDYMDLWVFVTEEDGEQIPEDERQMYQVQLSPQSVKKFSSFRLLQGVMKARGMGKDTEGVFNISTERNEFNGIKYANMLFSV